MANEIGAAINLLVSKNGVAIQRNASLSANMSGTHVNEAVADIATSATAIPLGSIATAGYAFLRNMDPTNFILIGSTVSASFVGVLKLKPGEFALVRINPAITLQGKADTATCQLEVIAIED